MRVGILLVLGAATMVAIGKSAALNMCKKVGTVCAIVAVGATVALPPAHAGSETIPYYAHPEHKLWEIYEQNSSFIFTEALNRIAMVHAIVGRKEASRIEDGVLGSSLLDDTFHLSSDTSRFQLQAQMNAWLRFFPSAGWQSHWTASGNVAGLAISAHQAIRLMYDVTGIDRMKTVDQILYGTVLGADPYYQDEMIKRLEKAADQFCSGSVAPEVVNAAGLFGLPKISREVVDAYAKLPPKTRRWLEGKFLGDRKTCYTLVSDLFRIVEPHHSPLGSHYKTRGQIEGTSILVAKNFFRKGDYPGEGALFRILKDLSKVERLDPTLDDWNAVKTTLLDESYTNRDLVLAFGAVSHNHSVELYLQKVIFELEFDPIRAASMSWNVLKELNHFYYLLNRHQQDRLHLGFKDLKTRAVKPYHYWGGALVACELVHRGYRPAAAEKFSSMVGAMYEFLVHRTKSESVDDIRSSEDAELHREGARFGVDVCQ